jgi:hypothetical protein
MSLLTFDGSRIDASIVPTNHLRDRTGLGWAAEPPQTARILRDPDPVSRDGRPMDDHLVGGSPLDDVAT